eukprot:SAG25_NODE_3766_length_977_cov_0.834852_2_plen_145_part_00
MLLFAVLILVLAFTKMINYQHKRQLVETYQKQCYFAARAGIEDAIYELKQGNTWLASDLASWVEDLSQTDTFYKDYTAADEGFEYAVTVLVTLTDGFVMDTYDVTSVGQMSRGSPSRTYEQRLSAVIAVDTFNNTFSITESQAL